MLKQLFYWLFKAKPSGLLPLPKDDRDFKVESVLGWGEYTPKHTEFEIKTVSVKDQFPLNTCQWNATIAGKEVDEQCELDVRSFVRKGYEMGLVSRDGFSNLRSGQKVLYDWGALNDDEYIDNPKAGWNAYINISITGKENKAKEHKTKTYWAVNNINDALRVLDEGRPVAFGMDWYSGYNAGGGFKSPWLISKEVGYWIGGHAVLAIGYQINYRGSKVIKVQNSYSKEWGDKGCFYITFDMFAKQLTKYGAYTNLDLDKDIGELINTYSMKNVKAPHPDNAVYYVYAGKRYVYPDWDTYLAFNASEQKPDWGVLVIKKEELDKIPDGGKMDIKNSKHWEYIKHLKQPIQYN